MLGIIIGISSVIAMSAIGSGGQKKITGSLAKSGFGVYELSVDTDHENYRSAFALDSKDVSLLEDNDNLEAISPNMFYRVDYKTTKNKNLRGGLFGTSPGYEIIDEVTYIMGRPILNEEFLEKSPVIVIDHVTANKIFPDKNPLGEKISIDFRNLHKIENFTIVGVFQHPDAAMNELGISRFIPSLGRISLPLMERIIETDEYSSILVKASDTSKSQTMLTDIMTELEDNNVSGIYEYEEQVSRGSSFNEILSTLNVFVTFVASISLLVGGIGVMNIMLVSVTERIKEIGIRKAIGAKNKDILFQFLTEAIVLSISGGFLGIIIGFLVAQIFGVISGINPIFSANIIVVSVVISTLIGLVFGVYPASQAAHMNPIDALRNE
jgi:putative ABC transport system permease protein